MVPLCYCALSIIQLTCVWLQPLLFEMVVKLEVVGKVVDQFAEVVGDKWQVAIKVAVQISGPVVVRVSGLFRM